MLQVIRSPDISGISSPQDLFDGVVNFALDIIGQITEIGGGGDGDDGTSVRNNIPRVGLGKKRR